MLRSLCCAALSLALSAALVVPASAQDNGDDWDFGQDAARKLTMAAVTFDNFGVAVRCMDQTLGVVVTGVQATEGEQWIGFAMAGRPERDTGWIGSRDGRSLFSLWPAAIATELLQGGVLSLGIPGGDRVRRMTVDLPPSQSAIRRVLSACNREPVDHVLAMANSTTPEVPDGENLDGLVWASVPQPNFPSETPAEVGIAALTCRVDARGGLRRCRIESEFPEGGGFGRAATLGTHRTGRVALAEGATRPLDGRTIAFLVRYGMAPIELRPPSRLSPPRATARPPGER